MATCYIGLGTNIGKKKENLKKALEIIEMISSISIKDKSSVKKTDPVDYLDQPQFLNQIIKVKTTNTPIELLDILQSIENKIGRQKTINKGPRIIDLDILLYDNLIISDNRLNIPHQGIKNRDFIMNHLIELDEHLLDPITKKSYKEIFQNGNN